MSRTPPDPGGQRASTFDRVAVYLIPLVIFGTVLALVVYGEAVTYTRLLAPDVNVTYVEGRFRARTRRAPAAAVALEAGRDRHRAGVGRVDDVGRIGRSRSLVTGVDDRHPVLIGIRWRTRGNSAVARRR